MKNKRNILLTVIFILVAAAAAAADQIDDVIKAEMQKQRIPGASVAVLKDGKLIRAQGYGLANVEHNVRATADTVYKIGSVSKQFIATGIMLLVEEGKLSLNDPISKYLEGTPDTWQPITIRHLLTHTSGLVREAPGFDPFKIKNDAEVIKTAYSLPLRFAPGEKWEYCNVGYFALAEIIRKVSGKPWSDYLQAKVFAPLGMSSTRTTSVSDVIPNRADGYGVENANLQNTEDWPALRPSGAFVSTVLDLAKWESALYSNKILKRSSLEQMWTPTALSNGRKHPYGFGWELADFRGISTIRHGGTLTGFRAQYCRFPDQGLTVIVLSNLRNANVESIALAVAVNYVPEASLATLQPKSPVDPETTKRLKQLLIDFSNGAKELLQATPELQQRLASTPQASRESLAGRLKDATSFEYLMHKEIKDKPIERLGVPVASIWHYRLGWADQKMNYSFYLTADGKVAFLEALTY